MNSVHLTIAFIIKMLSTKRCASGDADKPKKIRKSLLLEAKLKIIRRHNEGQRTNAIGKAMNLANSTVSTVLNHADKIRSAAEKVPDISAKRITRTRDDVMEETERLLGLWIRDITLRKGSLSVSAIPTKALSLFANCKERLGGPDYKVSITASHGWYKRLKNRADLKLVTKQGEDASADSEGASKFIKLLKEKIKA